MAIYKKQTVLQSLPGITIVEREADRNGVINLTTQESFTFEDTHSSWYVHSVVSAALDNNECPIAEYERAIKLGHPTHWASGNIVAISSSQSNEPPPVVIQLKRTDIIRFEGKQFILKKAMNDNIDLVLIEE